MTKPPSAWTRVAVLIGATLGHVLGALSIVYLFLLHILYWPVAMVAFCCTTLALTLKDAVSHGFDMSRRWLDEFARDPRQ